MEIRAIKLRRTGDGRADPFSLQGEIKLDDLTEQDGNLLPGKLFDLRVLIMVDQARTEGKVVIAEVRSTGRPEITAFGRPVVESAQK